MVNMRKVIIKNATIYHGDCFEIMQEISGADAMITDPPYGCTQNDWDHDIDFEKFWKLGKSACKQNAPFVIFCQMPFAARLYMSNPKMYRYDFVYVKPHVSGFLDANRKPLRIHESIYIFCEKLPKYRPQMIAGKAYKVRSSSFTKNYGNFINGTTDNKGERYPTSILSIGDGIIATKSLRHPTQKSVAVLSYLIKTYTDAGDTVIDPFMGSGSTGVAAVKHVRRFIGIEQDQKWFDVACKRIDDEYQKRGLLDMCEDNP